LAFLELLVQKEKFADALLTGIASYRSLQNSPLESSCVVVALTENYSTSQSLKVSPEKSHILSCDNVVANERYEVVFSVRFTITAATHMNSGSSINRAYTQFPV
jgi:hypothetical protein